MVTSSNAITVEVADKVAAAILRSGKPKSHIANASGIPLTTFMRKINGHTDFSLSEIDSVARSLGISCAILIPECMTELAS
jgi:hypothetical protein